MTVQDAITKAKEDGANGISDEKLVGWLSSLDGQIFSEVISWHEDTDEVAHGPYTTADMSVTLLVPAPYDEDVYVEYLKARINHELSETAKYNNRLLAHKTALTNYSAYYNRTHMPKQTNYIKGCTL